MTNYEEYLKFNEEKHAKLQNELLKEININADYTDKIKSINTKKHLLIFAEPFCPDCRILVSIVERIRKLNQVSIDVEYLSRKDNIFKLNMMSKEGKIPCVFLVDGLKVTKILEEYPNDFNATDELREDYRQGKYNDLIISTIVNALL